MRYAIAPGEAPTPLALRPCESVHGKAVRRIIDVDVRLEVTQFKSDAYSMIRRMVQRVRWTRRFSMRSTKGYEGVVSVEVLQREWRSTPINEFAEAIVRAAQVIRPV